MPIPKRVYVVLKRDTNEYCGVYSSFQVAKDWLIDSLCSPTDYRIAENIIIDWMPENDERKGMRIP